MSSLPQQGAAATSNNGNDGPGPLPRVFGRYVLFDRIGRGGMADIFLARADTGLGGSRLCVVKQILPALSRDKSFEQMLVAEAKLAARLTHANIVQVFDLGREADRLFIAMEYVEGFDLNQLLRALSQEKVGLSSEFAIYIVREVLRGLDYAHRQRESGGKPLGLVHRDVSPSNVLVSFEGEVRLCDFGIARALSAHHPEEGQGDPSSAASRHKVVGKSAYMSPEHARGEAVDARSDVFAAGILLWELCAGRRLYRGSEEEMLAAAKKADIPKVPPERGLVAQPVMQAVLDKALAPDPEQRFRSAQEFLQALEDYAATARQLVSQLRFGTFLTEHFGARIIEMRRQRELAVRDIPSELPPPLYPRTSSAPPARASVPPGVVRSTGEWRLSDRPPPESPLPPAPRGARDAATDDAADDEGRASDTVQSIPQAATLPTELPRMDSTSVSLDALPNMRVWSEPGLDDVPPALGSLEGPVAADYGDDPLGGELSQRELEASLSGISALDAAEGMPGAHVGFSPPAPEYFTDTPADDAVPAQLSPVSALPSVAQVSASPPAHPEREWIWYLAALFILALGLIGYFWR